MRKPTPKTYAIVTMYTGMGATLAGNAATADWSDPIGVVIAAFPALALFVTFEMVMRGRTTAARSKTLLVKIRTAIAIAAVIACAYVSVGHLLELAREHGQTGGSAWIIALLPDLMMLLAATVLQDTPAPRKAAARKRPAPITRKAPAPGDCLAPRRKTRTAAA